MIRLCHYLRARTPAASASFAGRLRCALVACALASVALVLGIGSKAWADLWEGFESAETAWKLAESDCQVRVVVHERTLQQARGGYASEHLQLMIGAGTKAYLTYDLPPAKVIDELRASVWFKSDRLGPQLWARVVLPRSREPRTGRPVTLLIPGDSYGTPGTWQKLAISDMTRLVERQARVLRLQLGTEIDIREAYIDKLVLNAYTEPGSTNVWFDDLEVRGLVAVNDVLAGESKVRQAAHQAPTSQPRVELDGSVLVADSRPIAVRLIEHNGESLEWLQAMGFNAVLLREPPTEAQLRQAEEIGLWLVAPPPRAEGRIVVSDAPSPILGWMLGARLGPLELEPVRTLAGELRTADSRLARPMIASVSASLSAYSRTANILLLEPPPLGGSLEMAAYSAWLNERPRLARPGTPCWTWLPSEPAAATAVQAELLGAGADAVAPPDYEQLRLLALTAVASGMRGICFASRTPLDGQDAASRQRADILRLINAELKLVEPWMAAGTHGGEVQVDDPQVRVSALQTERARLLVMRRHSPGQQYVLGPAERDKVTLVVPGTPSSMHAYRLSTLGMEPLMHKRVTGGTHLSLDAAGTASLIVLTQDPLVFNRVAKDLAALESQQARLHYDITARKLEATRAAVRRLPPQAYPLGARTIDQAAGSLQQALRLLAANDRRGAERYITMADGQLSSVQRGHWQAAVSAFASPVESPLCTSFATLPAHYALAERLGAAAWSDNVLVGGDMEQLQVLIESGWRHQRDPGVPVESSVELAPQSHTGGASLHLRAFAPRPEEAPSVLETPPVWVITPPVTVAGGKLVRIKGHVRTSPEIAGSHDGLLILDSIGGQPLAERIAGEGEWRQFTLFRAVPAETQLTVTFALSGLGEAWIDDVEIAILDLPPTRDTSSGGLPEEIPAPGLRTEEIPPPEPAARSWWPRFK